MATDSMQDSEKELLERVIASDMEAFRSLFETYQPVLFRRLLYGLRDADAAHDIVQETFVRVWQKRSSLQPDLSFLTYIFRISRNLVLDSAKHRDVRRRFEGEIPPMFSATDNPEVTTELSILEERLSQVVNFLPDKCREIFLLSRLEGMSNAEISKQLGLSGKTVENQITRALKVLRRHLREYTRQ
jgi:RNA polymerase sigma-70 factor, ECF subfamily